MESLKILNSLSVMIALSKVPTMDGSNQLDHRKVRNLIILLRTKILTEKRLVQENVKQQAIDALMECHPLGLDAVKMMIERIEFRLPVERCNHDSEPVEDSGGFLICPDCGTYGEDC